MESAIDGGKMNKEQARKEYEKIIHDVNKKHEEIRKKAQANGTWLPGLDSNNYLFKEVDNEAKEKIKELAAKVEE